MIKKVDPGTTIYVIWQDAASYDSWDGVREHAELKAPLVHSVGFFLKKDKEKLTLCLSLDTENGHASQSLSVPLKMIKAIYKLKKPERLN